MSKTYLTTVEIIDEKFHRSKYILHNGWDWYHSDTNNKEHMDELLKFFEIELTFDKEVKTEKSGVKQFWNCSKEIISKCGGGFWSIPQMLEMANDRRLKSFIGLSNGSLVTCYAAFDDDEKTIEILRPNPNAKDVYTTLPLSAHIEYVKNHWII